MTADLKTCLSGVDQWNTSPSCSPQRSKMTRKVWPQVDPQNRQTLRSNRATNPGSPDKPRPKRSSAEVAAEKMGKEAAKRNQAASQRAKMRAVAEKENEIRERMVKTYQDADHPLANTLAKVARVGTLKPTIADDTMEPVPGPKGLGMAPIARESSVLEFPESDGQSFACCANQSIS